MCRSKATLIRLPLDLLLVFTANPEDYTARGKIITPIKDRIGSEIRTHYPATLEHGIEITRAEAWLDRRAGIEVRLPGYITEIVEQLAFTAREDKRVDKFRCIATPAHFSHGQLFRTPSGARSRTVRRWRCPHPR